MGSKNVRQPDPQALSGRNETQVMMIKAVKSAPFTVASGPAGTGKTYIAARLAAAALQAGHVSRIVLTRPAVGAGETLGFLPGEIGDKLGPYLDEIVRVLKACFPNGVYGNLCKAEAIEIVPFEYMRSRTWDDAFIILDEAQNTTAMQMKLFTTRIGERSKVVVCGDTEQSDLPDNVVTGLDVLQDMIIGKLVPMARLITFDESDVVRSAICAQFVGAWGAMEATQTPMYLAQYKHDELDSETYEEDIYGFDSLVTLH